MKWLLLMLSLCLSIGGALVWQVLPRATAPPPMPYRNVNSRLAFEQPETPLAPATATRATDQKVVPSRELFEQPTQPATTLVHWATPAPKTRASNGGPSANKPHAEAALNELSSLTAQVERDPENLDLRFALAARQMSLRLWALAVIELEKVAFARSDDLAVRFNLAIAYQGAARLADARRAWDHVLMLDPAHLEARAYRGEVLLDLGEYGEAASDLEFVFAARPHDDAAALNLAAALQCAGKLQPALEIVEQLLNERPQHLPALKRGAAVAIALSESDRANAANHHQRAVEFARRALELAPRDQPIAQLLSEIQSRSP